MAYDQNSSYEPPQRAYQARAHPPAPVQNNYNEYANYASTPFDQPHDRYDQAGYAQQHHQPQYGGYDQDYRPDMSAGHSNGYEQSRPQQYDAQYGQEYAQQQDYGQDRQYDARYQPRAQQQQQQRPPPSQARGPPPSSRHGDPRNALRYEDQRREHGQHEHQHSNGYPPQANGYGNAPPQHSRQPHEQAPSKSSMDEWKAKEKAKLKAEARSPGALPFDNAFPVFGEQKNGRPSSKQSDGRGHRGSREQEHRPKTSGDRRPEASRENSYQAARIEAVQNVHHGAPGHAQPASQYPANELGSSIDQQFDFGLGHDASKHANGYHYEDHSRQPDYSHTAPLAHEGSGQRGPAVVPPIDTTQAHHYQSLVYDGRHPLSPTHAPPRPATSQGPRSQAVYQPAVPLSQPQSAAIYDDFASPPTKPFAQEDGGRPASIGDIYDDYGAEPAPKPLQRRPTTREEEIEADMPDFDSAAPAQTSRLQKRVLAGEAAVSPLPPPAAPATHPGLPQSSSAPDVRYEQRPQYQHDSRGPDQSGPPRHDGYHGGASSVPPQPYAQRPPPGHQDPRLRQGPPNGMQPPRAPFAHEPPVRRSLDDGRPIPYRNGPPPPQRFDAHGRPMPRGPPHAMRGAPNGMRGRGGPNGMPMGRGFPPRPDLDRQGTTWSDPGVNRTGSAPPPRGMPRSMGPPPLSQQRSAPEHNPGPRHPDALPHHPVPVRPGLMENGNPGQPSKPPPVRNYGGAQPPASTQPPGTDGSGHRQASIDQPPQAVTHAELDRLRSAVDGSPNNAKQALLLVRKLVEASTVLAAEGGRADPRTVGKNREKYVMEAHKRLKKLVNGGYPDAQFYLADCYGSGTLGLEVDPKEAFKLYQAAAKAGHAESAYRTAVCCEMGAEEGGGTSRDYAKAVQWYRRAAALGDGPGMYKLGAILLKGLLGQQRNITEAVIWLKRGAEKADADNPHALHELAQLYESGNTNPEVRNKVVADDAYARELFQQAASLGYKHSQFRLGQAYEYGALGCEIDNRTSIAYYTKAAAQGEHQAELALSGWYLTGAAGILENSDTEAYLWARKAASSEPPLAKAMFAMGYFTENGIGCPQSMDEARKWYSRAASYKFPKAIQRVEELKKGGGRKEKSAPQNGKLTRKDQKKDEENCTVM